MCLLLLAIIRAKNACDYISMAETGKYYAFSVISEFQSIANEVRIGGDVVARRVIPLTNRTLLEQLIFVAQEYVLLPIPLAVQTPRVYNCQIHWIGAVFVRLHYIVP